MNEMKFTKRPSTPKIGAALRAVVEERGVRALWKGAAPVSAFLFGSFQFGGYEFWKNTLLETVAVDKARYCRTAIYGTSAALCEVFASFALCPLEATRIRQLTNPSFATGYVSAFMKLWREERILRGLFRGYGSTLFIQLPFTITKFVVYEQTVEALYNNLRVKNEELSSPALVTINLGAGLLAGLAATLISQPCYAIVSKRKQEGWQLIELARELGVKGLFAGLRNRALIFGFLTTGQFAIYGYVRQILNAGIS